MAGKVTSPQAASAASHVLRSKKTGKKSKTAAGSALTQREKAAGKASAKKTSKK
jgi:hypothetical protein